VTPEWATAATALSVAVCGLLAWLGRHTWRVLRRVGHFLDDYQGQPARDGLPATPGFMARLSSVEDLLAEVAKQLTTNGGQSLRDVVQQGADDAKTVKTDLGELRRRVELFEGRRQNGDQS
jgi:hypothetical protein